MKVTPFELPVDEIRASLQALRRPLSVAILRARNPFNVGAIIRVAHSFLVREILLVGDERWYERGAMGMDRYENIVPLPTEADLLAHVRATGRKLVVFEKDAARAKIANVSTCGVWGSMSYGVTAVGRYPRAARTARSRARVSGSQDR
ncbi:MAG TPA: hypothetical protein VLT58_17770 [Polyangia bacterium]|nr:hypothetical protein [Polyangia bacterium]